MSPLLRRPDLVPSLFSLGIEADDRLPRRRQPHGIGALHRHLHRAFGRRIGVAPPWNAGRIALSLIALALVSKPLLKGTLELPGG